MFCVKEFEVSVKRKEVCCVVPGGRRVDPEVALGRVHAALGGAGLSVGHVGVDSVHAPARVVHVPLEARD